jgi:hypothetical protein
MTLTLRSWKRAGLVPAAVVFALFAAGCGSEPKPGPRGGQPPQRRAFIPMAGQETFFDGLILAEIHVGTEGMPEVQPGGGGGDRESGPRGRRRGGGGQMNVAGGAGGFGGNIGGNVPFGEGGRPGREGGGPGAGPRLGAMGGGRPVMIHLRFTNHGDAAVELRITDFVSPLGNFAVRPEKLVIEPGQSLETEPMTSQLAGAFTEAPATLALRLRGQAEKKTFPLRQVAAPPGPPSSK